MQTVRRCELKQKDPFKIVNCLFIQRNYSLAHMLMFHSSGTKGSDILLWGSIQKNSLHFEITLYSDGYRLSSSLSNLSQNHNFCKNLLLPSLLVQPCQTWRKAETPNMAMRIQHESPDTELEDHTSALSPV